MFATFPTKATNPISIPPVTLQSVIEVDDTPAGPLAEGKYAIRSCHGTYFRGHPGGESAKLDLQTQVADLEVWTLVRISGNVYGIRSAHGTYIRANPGGEGAKLDLQVDKHNWSAILWEQFVIVPANNGRYGIRSAHGTYIRAHPGGEGAKLDLQVDKHGWSVMPWEQFEFLQIAKL